MAFVHRKAWGGGGLNDLKDALADYYSQADLCQRNWIVQPHNRIPQQHQPSADTHTCAEKEKEKKKSPHCEPRSNKVVPLLWRETACRKVFLARCRCEISGRVIGLYLPGSIQEIGHGAAGAEWRWRRRRRWQRFILWVPQAHGEVSETSEEIKKTKRS